jgi:hypothetical protein
VVVVANQHIRIKEDVFFLNIDFIEQPHPDDTPGASPRRWGAPIAIILYYPDQDFSVILRNRIRTRPQWGQGWRKGGFKFKKKDFSRSKISSLTCRYVERTSECFKQNKKYRRFGFCWCLPAAEDDLSASRETAVHVVFDSVTLLK